MSSDIRIDQTGIDSVHHDSAPMKPFRQLSREQNVRQFALSVSVGPIVLLFTVQIGHIDFAPFVSFTRHINDTTGRRFLLEQNAVSSIGPTGWRGSHQYFQQVQQKMRQIKVSNMIDAYLHFDAIFR